MQFAYKRPQANEVDSTDDFLFDVRNRIFLKVPTNEIRSEIQIWAVDIFNQLSIRGRDILAVTERNDSTIYGWEFYPCVPGGAEDAWNYLLSFLREHIKEEVPLDRKFFEGYTFCI